MSKHTSEYECYGCGTKTHHDDSKGHVPIDWAIIKIQGTARVFCLGCKLHFHGYLGAEHPGDIAPSMKEDLFNRHGLKID